jgi:hypothetical protein
MHASPKMRITRFQCVFATACTPCPGHSVHTNMVWPQCAHRYGLASVHTNMVWPQCAHQYGLATVCIQIWFDHSVHSISNRLHNVQTQNNLTVTALIQMDHNLTCTTISQNKLILLTVITSKSMMQNIPEEKMYFLHLSVHSKQKLRFMWIKYIYITMLTHNISLRMICIDPNMLVIY